MSIARDPHAEPTRTAIQDEAIVDNLDLLLACLPGEIVAALRELATREELAAGRDGLLEIVMDRGRRPEARLTSGDVTLLDREVTDEDLSWVISRIGDFGGVRTAAPLFAGLCGISLFSSLGLPGLNGFVGEFLIFRGVFGLALVAAAVACLGLLATADAVPAPGVGLGQERHMRLSADSTEPGAGETTEAVAGVEAVHQRTP